jgi:cytochrome c biogenesis factor
MKFAVLLLNATAIFAVGIFVMIHGWGVQPKDWTVILAGYALLIGISGLTSLVKP